MAINIMKNFESLVLAPIKCSEDTHNNSCNLKQCKSRSIYSGLCQYQQPTQISFGLTFFETAHGPFSQINRLHWKSVHRSVKNMYKSRGKAVSHWWEVELGDIPTFIDVPYFRRSLLVFWQRWVCLLSNIPGILPSIPAEIIISMVGIPQRVPFYLSGLDFVHFFTISLHSAHLPGCGRWKPQKNRCGIK